MFLYRKCCIVSDDTPLFESDVNFWLIYVGVTLLVPLVLAVLPFRSNIVCCAILGSYSIILPIDYYVGSNLKYIVVNTVRRATVDGFNVAVIRPPYQGTGTVYSRPVYSTLEFSQKKK